VLSIADAGDAPVAPYDCAANAKMQVEFARSLGSGRRTRLFAVGGDHTIAYGNIHATWERQGKPKRGLPLVHFDSHLDTVDSVWGEKWGHASVFRRAIEDGLIDPKRMISVGLKGPLNSRADLEYARRKGIQIVPCEDCWAEGGQQLQAFVENLDGAPAYLTFDIDCVDPAFAPGTGTPSVGGFSSAEALDLIRMLGGGGGGGGGGLNIVGADVVEVLPDRDPCGITALLAAHVIFEVLALDASRRVKR
jgi:arginase family enzyme